MILDPHQFKYEMYIRNTKKKTKNMHKEHMQCNENNLERKE